MEYYCSSGGVSICDNIQTGGERDFQVVIARIGDQLKASRMEIPLHYVFKTIPTVQPVGGM